MVMTLEEFYEMCDAIAPDKYGCHNLPGRFPGKYHVVTIDGRGIRANRLVLERKLGRPIKPGYLSLHTCDWKSCINPDHLYEGTSKDNTGDMMERNLEYVESLRERFRSPKHQERLRKWRWSPENRERLRKMKQDPEHRKLISKRMKDWWAKRWKDWPTKD
jgi:hypothetical protein